MELFHSGVFREGEFDDQTGESLQFDCSPADIATMVTNFKRFASGDRPPLTPGVAIGHEDEEGQLFSDDSTLACGQVMRVWSEPGEIDGERVAILKGDLGVDDETAELVQKGSLPRVSAEIKESPPDGCDGEGCTLIRCALLGFAPAGAKRLKGTTMPQPNPAYSVRRFGDRVFMFSDLSRQRQRGGVMMRDDSFDDMADDDTMTMADDDGGSERDAAMAWLTDNGFDPVTLKIDDSTPDDTLLILVDALRGVVGGEDLSEQEPGGEPDGDEHDFAWEAFTTRKGTVGARGTGEHAGAKPVYGSKAERLLRGPQGNGPGGGREGLTEISDDDMARADANWESSPYNPNRDLWKNEDLSTPELTEISEKDMARADANWEYSPYNPNRKEVPMAYPAEDEDLPMAEPVDEDEEEPELTPEERASHRQLLQNQKAHWDAARKRRSGGKFSDHTVKGQPMQTKTKATPELMRLTTALNQVQQELVALKKNSTLLSRQQAREQIHTFCDTMVREGRMTPAAAERPTRGNPQGGEDYARLMRALTDPRQLVVHRFSGGKRQQMRRTVLQVEMDTIRSRPPVHRFSERIVGRTGSAGVTGDPVKSFDDWSKKHYAAQLERLDAKSKR